MTAATLGTMYSGFSAPFLSLDSLLLLELLLSPLHCTIVSEEKPTEL